MSAAAGLPAPEGKASTLRFPIYLGFRRPEPWSLSEQDLVDVAAGGRRCRDVSLPPSFPEQDDLIWCTTFWPGDPTRDPVSQTLA